MGARENEYQISQNYILHMKFSEFYLCNHNSCEIWHTFSDFHEKFSSVLLQMIYYVSSPWKCKKECNILYIILVQGFCPLKIKITQFPGGFRLTPWNCTELSHITQWLFAGYMIVLSLY